MNKLVITILIGIGLFSMFINKNLCTYNKTYRVNVIKIKKVDFNILTFAAVKCIDFDTYFNFPKEIIIKDKTLIDEILLLLNNLELIDSTYSSEIDTRAVIELKMHSKDIIICIGNLTTIKNGKIYKTSTTLKNIIESL